MLASPSGVATERYEVRIYTGKRCPPANLLRVNRPSPPSHVTCNRHSEFLTKQCASRRFTESTGHELYTIKRRACPFCLALALPTLGLVRSLLTTSSSRDFSPRSTRVKHSTTTVPCKRYTLHLTLTRKKRAALRTRRPRSSAGTVRPPVRSHLSLKETNPTIKSLT